MKRSLSPSLPVMVFAFMARSAIAQQPSPPALVWPLPPEKPRIEYRYSLSSKTDLGIEKSFLRKVWDFIVGAKDDNQRVVQPAGVAVDMQGRIYVTDPGAQCVHVFDMREKSYAQITETISGTFSWPLGIAIGNDGSIYVSDAVRKEVVVFSSDWRPTGSIRYEFERPTGIAVKADRIYVADTPLHKIVVFDLNGRFLFEFGKRGSGPGEFNFPVHLSGGKDLYVVDAMNHRVQVMSDSGKSLNQFGEVGNVVGTFASPKGIAIDKEGHVYVTDALFDALQIFDPKGMVLLSVGGSGRGPGEFQSPGGIFVDHQNNIYVVDSINRRIQVFRYLP